MFGQRDLALSLVIFLSQWLADIFQQLHEIAGRNGTKWLQLCSGAGLNKYNVKEQLDLGAWKAPSRTPGLQQYSCLNWITKNEDLLESCNNKRCSICARMILKRKEFRGVRLLAEKSRSLDSRLCRRASLCHHHWAEWEEPHVTSAHRWVQTQPLYKTDLSCPVLRINPETSVEVGSVATRICKCPNRTRKWCYSILVWYKLVAVFQRRPPCSPPTKDERS